MLKLCRRDSCRCRSACHNRRRRRPHGRCGLWFGEACEDCELESGDPLKLLLPRGDSGLVVRVPLWLLLDVEVVEEDDPLMELLPWDNMQGK